SHATAHRKVSKAVKRARGRALAAYRHARHLAHRLGHRVGAPVKIRAAHSIRRLHHLRSHWIHRGHHYWHLLRHVLRGRHATHFALTQLGKPYVYGAASPRVGFDCSGLVMWAYAHVGVRLPHSTYAQIRLGRHVSRRHLRRGDLVFTNG